AAAADAETRNQASGGLLSPRPSGQRAEESGALELSFPRKRESTAIVPSLALDPRFRGGDNRYIEASPGDTLKEVSAPRPSWRRCRFRRRGGPRGRRQEARRLPSPS